MNGFYFNRKIYRQDLQDIQDFFLTVFRLPATASVMRARRVGRVASRSIRPELMAEGRRGGRGRKPGNQKRKNYPENPACPVAPADLSAFGGWYWG